MAIGFVKPRYVSRSTGGSACNSSAYNSRTKIRDERTGKLYNWTRKDDNVFHEILLPSHVDQKFKNPAILANEVEANEHRSDSQLYVEWLLALPKEKEVTIDMKKEIIYRFIKYKGWVEEGVGVQIDIHKPHENEDNWHAHLLVTTRRFRLDGLGFEPLKARDLQPKVVNGVVIEETKDSIAYTNIQNDYYKECGLDLRVDLPGDIPQEHIGPVRMRSVLNQASIRNEERKFANIEAIKDADDVIARVTKGASIFNQKDLMRAVKIIPDEARASKLVADALSSQTLVPLYHEGGSDSGFYTTEKIRDEELKIMRLAGYINKQKNLIASSVGNDKTRKIINEDHSLNEQQREALSHLLLSNNGIKLLKGRAGTGKSYVLGNVATLAAYSGVNIIGLAPTHKAKSELEKVGYNTCDTIKGFLFKLHNSRVDLQKNSLIVVDEAGMVGNEDYSELLRVLAARNCNVILAGDERQLSSIGRGGMFEVLADKFGSYEMNDIKRQEVDWGRFVALNFAQGDIKTGIDILKTQKRLRSYDTKLESMEALLNQWNDSTEALENRLIIAVKNTDVDSLNLGARELLKAKGVLTGREVAVSKDGKDVCFMNNDRIVFSRSDRKLGLSNGDFATIESISPTSLIAKMDNGKKVQFDPSEFDGFKHAYASTIYKAQGASISDVYVLHDGFSTNKNSYVAMSRHIKDIHLYTNYCTTRTIPHLVKQLGFNMEAGSSLNYYTKEDLAARDLSENKGLFAKAIEKVGSKLKEQVTNFVDKNNIDQDYYQFEKPEITKSEVEEILDLVHVHHQPNSQEKNDENILELQEIAQANGRSVNVVRTNSTNSTNSTNINNSNNIIHSDKVTSDIVSNQTLETKQRMTAKERFYAARDYQLKRQATNQLDYEQEAIKLRQEVKWSAEKIARDLLGEPNKQLSDGNSLRFGGSGSIAVRISGEKCGSWYDFKEGKGGDLFDLVQERRSCDFKEAANYLRDSLGIENSHTSNVVYLHDFNDKYVDHHQQKASIKAIEAAKLKKIDNLHVRSKDIFANSTAHKYLEGRGIKCAVGDDVRTTGIYEQSLGKYMPAIIGFARNREGEITGGQSILLDPKTFKKADVTIAKKSFGKIAGSFVEVAKHKRYNGVTIIAEGLETALSIKEAGLEARILCSLGIGNIKNYKLEPYEKIIIAADNDGENSTTNKTINEARNILASSGAEVKIIKPEQIGDFNDLLQKDSITGILEIKEAFNPVVSSLMAGTLDELIACEDKTNAPQGFRGKLNPEFVLSVHNRLMKQISSEISEAKANKKIPKKINLDNLKQVVINYAFDRVEAQDFLVLSDNQAKALISRGLFELNNRDHINNLLDDMWERENQEIQVPLSHKIHCERITDKWTKVSGYLVEKIVLENPEKHLTIKKDDDILRQSYELSTTRQEKLATILENDPQIKELASLGISTQNAVAEQLVDYRLQHGMDVNVTSWKFESMKEAAMLEHELSKTIDKNLTKILKPSFAHYNMSRSEKIQSNLEGRKLVIHNLRNDVHDQSMHSTLIGGNDQNSYTGSIIKSLNRLQSIQTKMDKQLEERQHQTQTIKYNGGMGMGM